MAVTLKRTKQVQRTKTVGFYKTGESVAGLETLIELAPVPPRANIQAIALDITYGITDDPADELVEFFLAFVDRDNIPAAADLRRIAEWQEAQNWRSIGTDAGPIETFDHAQKDFFTAPVHSTHSLAARVGRFIWALIAVSSTTSLLHVQGTFSWAESLEVRTFTENKLRITHHRTDS